MNDMFYFPPCQLYMIEFTHIGWQTRNFMTMLLQLLVHPINFVLLLVPEEYYFASSHHMLFPFANQTIISLFTSYFDSGLSSCCLWYGALSITITDAGGKFGITHFVYQYALWLTSLMNFLQFYLSCRHSFAIISGKSSWCQSRTHPNKMSVFLPLLIVSSSSGILNAK
jgi:hypothetical protein